MEGTSNSTELKPIDGMTVKEAAFVLRVAPKTVYGWCADGKIRFFRVMGSIRIDKAAVGAVLSSTCKAE